MTIETPLHAEHQLDQGAAQFEYWRQTRRHPGERFPQALWDQAVALAATLPPARVAKQGRLRLLDLKKQRATSHAASSVGAARPLDFVEVHAGEDPAQGKRLRMDGKATVNIGAFSRGGYTRGDHPARDHDLGCKEKYIPCGSVDEDTAQL